MAEFGLGSTAITCRLLPRGRLHLVDDDLGLCRIPCYALARDRQGRLWVGTEDGPITFDGLAWASQAQATGTSGRVVRALAADPDGRLWLATGNDGVYWIEARAGPPRILAHLTTGAGLPSNTTTALHVTADGAALVGTDRGLAVVRAGRVISSITTAEGLPHAEVRAVAMDDRQVAWAGTAAGLAALRGTRLTDVDPCTGPAASSAVGGLVARDGVVLAGLANGAIIQASWTTGAPRAHLVTRLERGLRSLTIDRRGHLWVGSATGLTMLDGAVSHDRYSAEDGLPGHGTWAILCDDEGRVWVGTSAGLALLQQPVPVARAVPADRPGAALPVEIPVYAVAQEMRGRTWLASEAGLAIVEHDWSDLPDRTHRQDGDQDRPLTRPPRPHLPPEVTGETVWALQPDPAGYLWVGTRRDGALRLDTATGVVRARYAAGSDVPSLALAAQRYLWACVSGRGLLVVDLQGDEPPRWITAEDGLPDDRALCVGVTPDGVAAGGWGGWVAELDARGTRVRATVRLRAGAAGRPVTDICGAPGAQDGLWVASYGGGLLDLDPQTLAVRRVFTTDSGLPSDLAYACRTDAHGCVWVGTSRGVVRLSPLSGHAVVIGRVLGLPSEECNGQALTIAADGRIWIGTVRGAAIIDAPRLAEAIRPPTVYLAALAVMGQERAIADAVHIDDTDYDVVFSYGAVEYTAPAQVLYRVRLEGLDPTWSRPSRERSIRYTNLACGAYTFQVQARNWGGRWSESATLRLVVTRSARGQELDRARAQAAAAEAARTQAEAAVRVRNEVLRSVVHDLRTPLTGIMGQADLLRYAVAQTQDPDQAQDRAASLTVEALRERLARLKANARRMAGMLDEISDVIQLDTGHPLALTLTSVDLTRVIEAAVATICAGRGPGSPRVTVDADDNLVVRGDQARLTRVLENIVGNAVKYSRAPGVVRLDAHARGDVAVIVVADHGVGIPAAEVPHLFTPYFRASTARGVPGSGLGLAGARTIIEQHGGTIQVDSVQGEGTTVTLVLPCGARTGIPTGRPTSG